jgi:hypothetical protein
MEENWLWYLSGAVDSLATLVVRIRKDDRYELGYQQSPELHISRDEQYSSIYGMLDEYCEEHFVKYRIDENKGTQTFAIGNPESIVNFLQPIVGGFIQQQQAAMFLVDEYLPLFEKYRSPTKPQFIELMEKRDKLREYSRRQRNSKYDADYFRDLWSDELSGE